MSVVCSTSSNPVNAKSLGYVCLSYPSSLLAPPLWHHSLSHPPRTNHPCCSFVGGKVPCPYGPSAGDEGFRKNVEYFKDWREKVGPDYPLMLDCYMALTVPYAIKLAKALQPYGLKWIEECLHPDDYDGYEQVAAGFLSCALRCPLAACPCAASLRFALNRFTCRLLSPPLLCRSSATLKALASW